MLFFRVPSGAALPASTGLAVRGPAVVLDLSRCGDLPRCVPHRQGLVDCQPRLCSEQWAHILDVLERDAVSDRDAYAPFVNIGPTDWNDPSKPRSMRFVPQGAEILGWTPFEIAHPECFANESGEDLLRDLIERASSTGPS